MRSLTRSIALLVVTSCTSCTVSWRTATVATLPENETGYEVLIVERDLALDLDVTSYDETYITGELRHAWRISPTGLHGSPEVDRATTADPEIVATSLGWQPVAVVAGQRIAVKRSEVLYVRLRERHLERLLSPTAGGIIAFVVHAAIAVVLVYEYALWSTQQLD